MHAQAHTHSYSCCSYKMRTDSLEGRKPVWSWQRKGMGQQTSPSTRRSGSPASGGSCGSQSSGPRLRPNLRGPRLRPNLRGCKVDRDALALIDRTLCDLWEREGPEPALPLHLLAVIGAHLSTPAYHHSCQPSLFRRDSPYFLCYISYCPYFS